MAGGVSSLPLTTLILLLLLRVSSPLSSATGGVLGLAQVGTPPPQTDRLAAPEDMEVTGRNLFFIVKWRHPPGCQRCVYDVRWQKYGSHNWTEEHCGTSGVGESKCDLGIFKDLRDKFLIQVRASSGRPGGQRVSDWTTWMGLIGSTIVLDPPIVKVSGAEPRLELRLPVLGPVLRENVTLMAYTVMLTAPGTPHTERFEASLWEPMISKFRSLAAPELCVSARATLHSGRVTDTSAPLCFLLGGKALPGGTEMNTVLLVVLLLLTTVLLLSAATAYYFAKQYLHPPFEPVPRVLADLPMEEKALWPSVAVYRGPPPYPPDVDCHPVSPVSIVLGPKSSYDRVAICGPPRPALAVAAVGLLVPNGAVPPGSAAFEDGRWPVYDDDDDDDNDDCAEAERRSRIEPLSLEATVLEEGLLEGFCGDGGGRFSGPPSPSRAASSGSLSAESGDSSNGGDDSLMSRMSATHGIDAGWLLGEAPVVAAPGGQWQPVSLRLSDICSMFEPT